MSYKCTTCNEIITLDHSSRSKETIGFIHKEKPYCHKCLDAITFLGDWVDSPEKIKSIKTPSPKKPIMIINEHVCHICKNTYIGKTCSCGQINPLMVRPTKGKKKRKNKKK